MNERSPEHGLDQAGFVAGAFISGVILAFQANTGWQWLIWMPVYTALIGFPIAALVYAEARKAFHNGFMAGIEAAKGR